MSDTALPIIFHKPYTTAAYLAECLHPVKDQGANMLHVTEVLDVVKNAQIFLLRNQEENPETSPKRNPEALDNSHQQFQHFQYLSLTGPHQVVSQIQVLCRQWLQPETHTKEQIIERLVLEQFLSTLPEEIQKWVRSKQPKNSREAGMLVENLIQACEDPGETASPAQDSVLAENKNTKEDQQKNTEALHKLPSERSQELVTFEDVAVTFTLEELSHFTASQKKLYWEVMLENYQNLVSLRYQFPKPDIISYLEEEVSRAIEEDSSTVICPRNSSDPSESHEGNRKDYIFNPVTMSDTKTLAQERSYSNDEFERRSVTQQSEGLPGKDPQECSITGMGTRPQLVQHFRCKICERAFSTKIGLVRHKPIHTGKKPFKCKQCREAFFLMPHLTRHQKSHASDNHSKCNKDGKSFIQHADLSGQVTIHRQEDYFECIQCGKTFIQGVHLSQHLKVHSAAKAFSPVLPNKTYLIHYQREHDYVRERACKCCDCGKTFSHSSHLIQHYRIHAREKPYQCKLCGKCFGGPSHLSEHYQLHFQEKTVDITV